MIKMMNRISSTAMLAVAFMLCATSAWAATINCSQGQDWYVTTTETTVFENVRLSDIGTKYRLCGKMKGGYIPAGGEVYATSKYSFTSETAVRYELQILDGATLKCIAVKLTEESVNDGESYNVRIQATHIGAKNNWAYGSQFVPSSDSAGAAATDYVLDIGSLSTNGTNGQYGIYDLRLVEIMVNCDFNGDLSNTGTSSGNLSSDVTVTYAADNKSIYTFSRPYKALTYPTEWTAVFRCTTTKPKGGRVALITFGNNGGNIIGLTQTANNAGNLHIADQGGVNRGNTDVTDPRYSTHVYALVRTASNVALWVDGVKKIDYSGTITPASGFQLGTTFGGDDTSNFLICDDSGTKPSSRFDFLQFYGGVLPENVIKGFAAEYPVEYLDYSASVSADTDWSNIAWDEGSWENNANIDANVTAANSPKVTFDSAVTAGTIAFTSTSGGLTLAGTEPTATVDYSGIAGAVTLDYLTTQAVSSRSAGITLNGGAGAEGAAIAFTPAGGSITFDGSGETPYYLSFGNSGTSTTINFNDAEVFTSSFDLGTATATVGGDSDITATRVILSQGAVSRTASLTVKDSAKLTVTGTTNADQNTASIMFGHWNGPSTFTLQNSAEFSSPDAYVLVGRTGNAQTINIEGGLFSAKGIFLSEQAYLNSGVDRLNISGGELRLGNTGITSNSGSSTMPVNVTDDAKISTMTSSTEVPITQAVTVSADKTLTLDGGGTITFTSLTLNAGSSLVLANGTKAVINGGTIDDDATINVGTGIINIKQLRPSAEFTFASGGRLEMTEVTSESGTTALNVANDTMPAVTLYDASGNALAGVIPSISGSTLTIKATGGKACWMDYEFNGNTSSIGSNTTGLSGGAYYSNNDSLYAYSTPYRDVTYPGSGSWSAVVRCTKPETENSVIVTFGSTSAGSKGYIGFVGGGDNSVKCVARSGTGSVETLVNMDISSATLAQHVYAIVKTSSSIKVYLDGVEKYSNSDKAITIGGGMQIGSMHGGCDTGNGFKNAGNVAQSQGTPARIDFIRMYDTNIDASVIEAIAADFADSPTELTTIIGADSDFASLSWNKGSISTWPNNYKSKMVVGVIDNAVLTLPESLCAYDITFAVASGKTLTLQCAENGSALCSESGVTIGMEGYNGTVRVAGTLTAGPFVDGVEGAALALPENSTLIARGTVDVDVSAEGKIGTIVYDRYVPNTAKGTSVTNSSKWNGTVWLKNFAVEGMDFNDYGNSTSTVKLTGVSGYIRMGTYTIDPTLEMEGSGITISNGAGADRVTISELKGTGIFKISSNSGAGIYHIKKVDDFTGTLDTVGKLLVLGDPTYNVSTETDTARGGKVILKCNTSVASGKTWNVKNGLNVNGKEFVVNGSFSGKFLNTGTVTIPASCTTASVDSGWTGTVIVPAVTISTKTGIGLKYLSSTGGTLVIKGITRTSTTSIYLDNGTSDTIKGTTQLDGDLVVSDGNSGTTFTWNKITGVGNLTLRTDGGTATPITHAITTLDNYTGRIDAKSNKAGKVLNLTIGTVNVPALDLTVGDPLVKLASDANLTTSVDDINVTVANAATAHKLYKAADGNLYVKVASVTVDATTMYYPTLKAAADAALAAGGETVTFTRVDSDAGTELTGWTYSDDVFTFNNEFAYNETKDLVYGTLQDAITASSKGDTIMLLADTDADETAVDTTGKDFIFDENGYAFSGTWTGSGIITLPSAPVQTTWSSDMFVSTGDTVWTGKVVLGWDIASGVLPLCNYGIAGSTVEVTKTFTGWFDTSAADLAISPTIEISGSMTVNNGHSGKIVTFTKVKGSGTLTFDCLYTHNITTLENWDGVLTYANTTAGSGSISRIESGSGKVSSVRSFTPTFGDDWQGTFEIKWTHSSGNLNINNYGTANSSVTISTAVTGGFVGTSNAATTYNPKLVLDAEFKLDNGYAYSSYQNALSNKSVFEAVAGDGNMTFAFTSGYSGYWTAYQVNTFENYGGTITLPERNEIVIGKLKYPSSASASLVPDTKLISISAHSNSKILNSSLGDVTTAGVPVYVENADSGMKAVYKTDGLYIAVAQVGTAYYATIHDAIAAAGGGSVTVTLLVDTDEDVALAHGQVLDTGTTSYSGTVSAADSKAKILPDGTTYKVVYGTIFSVY